MTDHKFERDIDREVTPSEIKNRLIVLMENGFEMPTVHIYDEPVRYLKMNLEWFKIFSGVLSWMEHPAFWKDAQDYDFEAIEQILLFEEGIEPTMATQQDIAKGMYQAFNWLALQIASGSYQNVNISTDEDGVVTLPSGGDTPVELPEDDPSTPLDESLAAQMGGTIEVNRALELFYDTLDGYYGATNGTPVKTLAESQALIKAFFECDAAAMDTAIADYYTYRAANARITFDTSATIQNYLFCRGGGESAWGKWLASQSGYAIAKLNITKQLSDALADAFWTNYFADGSTKPSSQYLDSSCVKIPDQTLTALTFGVARSSTIIKPQHRYLFIWDGKATDTDGDTQDPFYFRTAAGVLTFTTPTIVHGAGSNLPSSTQVPYNAAGHYEYTTDSANLLNNAYVITMNKHANLNATGLVYTTQFNVTIKDLGEYAVS